MTFAITTWNINSVRLRLEQVLAFLKQVNPDVLCLQETKCPDDRFPLNDFKKLGYEHSAIFGQKGYHGVATLSKWPLTELPRKDWCTKGDARHIGIRLSSGPAAGTRIHNFYIPAGGDEPDPDINPKFAHKLLFLEELAAWGIEQHQTAESPAILVGDLNIAPYEHDVWDHRKMLNIVSHTPIETQKLESILTSGRWIDAIRTLKPQPEKVYTWWSYRAADWLAANKGRRLDHIWVSHHFESKLEKAHIHQDVRGWERPSDHAPLTLYTS